MGRPWLRKWSNKYPSKIMTHFYLEWTAILLVTNQFSIKDVSQFWRLMWRPVKLSRYFSFLFSSYLVYLLKNILLKIIFRWNILINFCKPMKRNGIFHFDGGKKKLNKDACTPSVLTRCIFWISLSTYQKERKNPNQIRGCSSFCVLA